MSGPKGIQYRVDPKVARRLAEEQRSRQLLVRWRQIESAAIRLSARCHAHDLPFLAVAIPTVAADDTAQMEALADQLEHEVNQSNRQLDAKVRENRSRRFDHDLEAVLTDLAAVEEAARVARPVDVDKSADTSRNASDCTAAERRKRLSDQVSRRLGRLVEPASEIEDFAVAVVTAPLDRAPMLLDELDAQISERNAITNRVGADNSRLDALRVKAAALQDAAAVGGLLAQAANEIECQRSAAAILDAVTNLVDAATARVTAEVERQYVLDAVRESLEELGYVTTEVDGGGPDSVVLSRAGSTTHGVRARVSEGRSTCTRSVSPTVTTKRRIRPPIKRCVATSIRCWEHSNAVVCRRGGSAESRLVFSRCRLFALSNLMGTESEPRVNRLVRKSGRQGCDGSGGRASFRADASWCGAHEQRGRYRLARLVAPGYEPSGVGNRRARDRTCDACRLRWHGRSRSR